MEFFKSQTHIRFMTQRKWATVFSAIVFLSSILSLFVYKLNLGLDFQGGTQAEITFKRPVQVNQIRNHLLQSGFSKSIVQAYDLHTISVRTAPDPSRSQDQLRTALLKALPDGKLGQLEYVGPQVGKQLVTNGILAVLVALIGTIIYIAFRFELRFALSAAIALIHDPILILGIFSFFQIEFNLIVLAAVLTVIGYSLNDTIVVYDRVRENFRKIRKRSSIDIMDLSINQTLSRTIMTSGLTLLVVIVLCVFGGPTLRPFAAALAIGIVIGTYSSIYVAGALAVSFGLRREHLVLSSKQKTEDHELLP